MKGKEEVFYITALKICTEKWQTHKEESNKNFHLIQ